MAPRVKVKWLLVALYVPLAALALGGGFYAVRNTRSQQHASAPTAQTVLTADTPPLTPASHPTDAPSDPPETKPDAPPPPRFSTPQATPGADAPKADPPAKVQPAADRIIYFEAPKFGLATDQFSITDLLRRELFRQGVVIAARDHLGLTPRDEVLGDLPPRDLPDEKRFRVSLNYDSLLNHEVTIATAKDKDKAPVSAVTKPNPTASYLMAAVANAETFSREEYVVALKRAGLAGPPIPVAGATPTPPEIERLLEQMTFTAQFAAVRQLHDLMREKGESPTTLGGLSRGYANLGMLTDLQWGGHTWVFKARSLLYAERLRRQVEVNPLGYWHRGYALALIGLHADALTDLSEGDKRRGTVETPVWATLAGHLCRFDTAKLTAAAADQRYGDTARVFGYLTVESHLSRVRAIETGLKVVERIPDCYRVHDSLASFDGVKSHHITTVAGWKAFDDTFADRVATLPGLPTAVLKAARKGVAEPELVKALFAAGRAPDDRSGLTWATLAGFAREARFVQATKRMRFLREGLSVSVDDELSVMKPLLIEHPLYPFLVSYTIDKNRTPVEYRRQVLAAKPPELTYRHTDLMAAVVAPNDRTWEQYMRTADMHGSFSYHECYLRLRWEARVNYPYKGYDKQWQLMFPHAPIILANAIENADKLKLPDELLAKWEAETQHPEPLVELAKRALAKNNLKDAARLLKRASALSPESATTDLLVQVYRSQGDDANWLATLEQSLKQPDVGLNHARVRVEIANHFMARGDYKKAWPYAEAAAQSWARWAMETASWCAERNGDMKAAELWIRRVSERYASGFYQWYYWCVRTGEGNRREARQLFEANLVGISDPPKLNEVLYVAVYAVSLGKPKKAGEVFEQAASQAGGVLYSYHAAVQYDLAGETDARDRVLDTLEKNPLRAQDKLLGTVGKHMRAKDAPTAEEVKQILAQYDGALRKDVVYLFGRILFTRNEPKRAAELFKELTKTPSQPNDVSPTLAGQALQDMEGKEK